MNKFKLIIALTLIAGSSLFFIFYLNYKYYSAEDTEEFVDSSYCAYFNETYDECRNHFIKNSLLQNILSDSADAGSFKIPSETDTNLFVDWSYFPAKSKKEKLLVINSGLHGIEGYTGSAIQSFFIQNHLQNIPSSMGVLLIHGINAYGFKYHRKVTENNIDLNRNCVISKEDFNTENKGYGEITDLIMPQKPVDFSDMDNQLFFFRSMLNVAEKTMPVIKQATLQGQYEYRNGFYYGGKEYEPQIKSLQPLLTQIFTEYPVVLNIDLHTGYGERGNMHLFINKPEDTTVLHAVETIFEGEKFDWGCTENFYTIKGCYVEWANNLAPSSLCIPMALEFGTLNSQDIMGSVKSLQAMVAENQGKHNGYKTKDDEQQAKYMFNELYYPSSNVWRTQVISQADSIFTKIITNLSEFKQ